MKKDTVERIKVIVESCVDNVIQRANKKLESKPFHEALLTKKLILASAIERSFSSSFGQTTIEEVSKIISDERGGQVERLKHTWVNVTQSAIDEIERIMTSLRSGGAKPNWKQEIDRVAACSGGVTVPRRIISDLWINRDQTQHFISLKTVKPNLGQCIEAKQDMLYIKAYNRDYQTYICLYYNPFGSTRKEYKWSFFNKVFDVARDDCVLIGKDYWDFIGGKGTYVQLIGVFNEIGNKTRNKLESIGH